MFWAPTTTLPPCVIGVIACAYGDENGWAQSTAPSRADRPTT